MAKILYIEDYQAAAITMQYVMMELGHQCVIATNGAEALDLYKRDSFDMILIDNQLPDIPGPEVAKAIRQWEKENGRSETILIGYSAGSKLDAVYRDAGMNGYAMKSLSLDDVRRLVTEYLG